MNFVHLKKCYTFTLLNFFTDEGVASGDRNGKLKTSDAPKRKEVRIQKVENTCTSKSSSKDATTDSCTSKFSRSPKVSSDRKNEKLIFSKTFRFQAKTNLRTTIYPDTSQDISNRYNNMSCKSYKNNLKKTVKLSQTVLSESDNYCESSNNLEPSVTKEKPQNFQTVTSISSCNKSLFEKSKIFEGKLPSICKTSVETNSIPPQGSLINDNKSSFSITSPKLPINSSCSYSNTSSNHIKSFVKNNQFEVKKILNSQNISCDLPRSPRHKTSLKNDTIEGCDKSLKSKKTIFTQSFTTPSTNNDNSSLKSTQTYVSSCELSQTNKIPEKLSDNQEKKVFNTTPSFLSAKNVSTEPKKCGCEVKEKSFSETSESHKNAISIAPLNSPQCQNKTVQNDNFIVLSPLSDNQDKSFSKNSLPLTNNCKLDNCHNSTMIEGRPPLLVQNTFLNTANISSIKGY